MPVVGICGESSYVPLTCPCLCSCLPILVIQLRKRRLHLLRDLTGGIDIHQRSPIHPRTIFRRRAPFAHLVQQLRPVGERTALQRFDLVYRAAIGEQKWTLFLRRFPEPQQPTTPAKIAPRKLCPSQTDMPRQPRNVIAIHVHKSLLLAAAYASGLALEAHLPSVSRNLPLP